MSARGLVLVGAVALWAQACSPGPKKCVYDTGCNPTDQCVDGLCQPRDAGGAGGGTGGGSGGGAAGGSGGGSGCDPQACSAFEECGASACVPRYAALEWLTPAPDTTSNAPDGGLELVAQLRLAPGRSAAFPTTLTFTVRAPGGASSALVAPHLDGGTFWAMFPLPPAAPEGDYLLSLETFAGLDAGLRSFVLDRTAPVFTGAVEAAPLRGDGGAIEDRDPALPVGTNAFRRDERFDVAVSCADVDVDDAGVTLSVAGVLLDGGAALASTLGVAQAAGVCRAACGAGTCRCFTVDAALPVLEAARGQWKVSVTLTDRAGNQAGPSVVASPWVTRWKWRRSPASAVVSESAPAVDLVGRIFFGTAQGVTSLSSSGQRLWASGSGNVRSAVAVGQLADGGEAVFFANAAGTLGALDANDGGILGSCSDLTRGFANAPALAFTSANGERELTAAAMATMGVSAPMLIGHRPGTVNQTCTAVGLLGFNVDWPNNTAANDAGFYFSGTAGMLEFAALSGAGWNGSAALATGIAPTFGLALDRVSGDIVSAGVGVARTPFSLASSSAALAGTDTFGPPVASRPGVWWAGSNAGTGELRRFGPSAVAATAVLSAPLASAPVAGARSLLYLADNTGDVEARSTADLSLQWRLALGEAVAASPNLDVSRDPGGAKLCTRPGVLYVLATSGNLYALLVDSNGIDPAAPWPKYQRDPANSGNADWAPAGFTCP